MRVGARSYMMTRQSVQAEVPSQPQKGGGGELVQSYQIYKRVKWWGRGGGRMSRYKEQYEASLNI